MKVLILHKWLVSGGAERVLCFYLDILSQITEQVDLLLTYDLGKETFFQPSQLKANNIYYVLDYNTTCLRHRLHAVRNRNPINKFKYEGFKYLNENRKYNAYIKQLVENNHYNVVIDFSNCLDKFMKSAKPSNFPPTIRWVHLPDDVSNSKRKIAKFKPIFAKHNKVVCICPEMTEILQSRLDLPKEKFSTLFNPINIENITKQSIEQSKIIEQEYLLQVSRLVEMKNHKTLLEIYHELKQKGVKHKLVFIGDGEKKEELLQQINTLGLKEDCILLGEIKNPYPYMKNATLFLHTSKQEGLPTVLLESIACGTPVVAMACPTGPRDILGKNSEYGKLIPMGDKNKFIESVLDLLNNQEIYQHYKKQSLNRIQDFSMDKIASELKQLLEKVMKNK